MTYINIVDCDKQTVVMRSQRNIDVKEKHLASCAQGFARLVGGQEWQLFGDESIIVKGKVTGKYAFLTVYSGNQPVLDIGFAAHSLGARKAWEFAGGQTDIPSVPFLASSPYKDADMPFLVSYAKHLLAWSLYDYMSGSHD